MVVPKRLPRAGVSFQGRSKDFVSGGGGLTNPKYLRMTDKFGGLSDVDAFLIDW